MTTKPLSLAMATLLRKLQQGDPNVMWRISTLVALQDRGFVVRPRRGFPELTNAGKQYQIPNGTEKPPAMTERFILSISIPAPASPEQARHARSQLKKLAGDAVWEVVRQVYGEHADVVIR